MCFCGATWPTDQPLVSRRRFVEAGFRAGVAVAAVGWAGSTASARAADAAGSSQVAEAPGSQAAPTAPGVIALTGGRIHPAPDAPLIARGVVLVRGHTIAAVGSEADVSIPADARVVDCAGLTLTAAFWNCHVHFIERRWQGADTASPAALASSVRAMLTRHGFATVVDTGSPLPNTQGLARRIGAGEVPGPNVITAGGSFAPPNGSPYYIQPVRVPELGDPKTAETLVDQSLDAGADAIKLFTGSWATQQSVVLMPVDVVRGATAAAHRRGKLVLAHPSTGAGARAAIDGGVDILAHTFPSEIDGPWDRSLPELMRRSGMALIPTLKLWSYETRRLGRAPALADRLRDNAATQVKMFADAGGEVLFGTDVGYMLDYDPADEYVLLERAGLSFRQILAALTTNPAARFGRAARTG